MSTNKFLVPLSIDVVILALIEGGLNVALLKRPDGGAVPDPYAGWWSLPGGTVDKELDEDTSVTVARVLAQKGGIQAPYAEQLRLFSGKNRDPRGWSAALAHVALVAPETIKEDGPLTWFTVESLPELAFDHGQMVLEAVARVRNKTSYSTLPLYLMPAEFTLSDLQSVYEELLGEARDKRKFRRMIEGMKVVVPLGKKRSERGRPADLYQVRRGIELLMLPGAF
jgi:8-oxo-dGTP diphosphatase